jgi:hypothetical protein
MPRSMAEIFDPRRVNLDCGCIQSEECVFDVLHLLVCDRLQKKVARDDDVDDSADGTLHGKAVNFESVVREDGLDELHVRRSVANLVCHGNLSPRRHAAFADGLDAMFFSCRLAH